MSLRWKPPLDRLMAGVLKTDDGCWEWQKTIHMRGYGQLTALGERYAHRVAYRIFHGPIPDGLQIDHLCRNRACVNPDHLEVVTPRENQIRGFGPCGINARKTHCNRGHEFTPENTYGGNGKRRCRQCTLEWRRRRDAEKRAMA